jgi:hypothetical protein
MGSVLRRSAVTMRYRFDLQRAVSKGLIAKSPCLDIELPRVVRDEQRYLTGGDVVT